MSAARIAELEHLLTEATAAHDHKQQEIDGLRGRVAELEAPIRDIRRSVEDMGGLDEAGVRVHVHRVSIGALLETLATAAPSPSPSPSASSDDCAICSEPDCPRRVAARERRGRSASPLRIAEAVQMDAIARARRACGEAGCGCAASIQVADLPAIIRGCK